MRAHAAWPLSIWLATLSLLGTPPAAGSGPAGGRHGLSPALSRVYGPAMGLSVGGYGEMLYQNFARTREDGAASGRLDRIDLARVSVVVGYRFRDDLLLNSEVALEHAGVRRGVVAGQADPVSGEVSGETDLGGQVALGFAYLEWAPTHRIGARAGLLLLPVGIVNEYRDPPLAIGALAPEVERTLLPTPWRGAGIGIFGSSAGGDGGSRGLCYRLYVTEGLDGARFTADGYAGGRQDGSRSLATQPLLSARLDYAAGPSCVLGAAVASGNTWQGFQPGPLDLAPRLTLFDLHGRMIWRGLTARALYVRGRLSQAGALSDQLALTGSSRLGTSAAGGYAELAYDVLSRRHAGSGRSLSPYLRLESYDTQDDVPGGEEDPARERSVITLGAAFLPHPQVVVRAEHQWRSDRADAGVDQWNLGLGWAF